MRIRDSGMPAEADWEAFFNPLECLQALGLRRDCRQLVDLGAGYGTFSLAAAGYIRGRVLAVDSDPDMTRRLRQRSKQTGLANINVLQHDFMAGGSGLEEGSADVLLAFNILHAEQPQLLYREARRVLRPAGQLLVMHWRCDVETPRGPGKDIRPSPAQLLQGAQRCGFRPATPEAVALPPWHYGWQFIAPS